MFLENRFRDKKKILMTVSSVIIVVFFAVCTTDFIQGTLMLVALLAVPICAVCFMNAGGLTVTAGLAANGVTAETAPGFLNMFADNNAVSIISGLAWGLGYFGMPHIIVRFMAVKSEKEMTKSKTVAIIWVTLSLVAACVIGIIGRAYMDYDLIVNEVGKERIFIEIIKQIFTKEINAPLIAGIFLCGILAAIMSTADSQLLVSASAVAEDLYKGIIKKDADDKKVLTISRITIVVIAVIALDPDSSIMGLVSNAWAGLGAAFGPLVLMALFWKRTNFPGAVAGLLSGALTVIIWDYIPMINGAEGFVTLGSATGLYSLAVGFPLSLLCIVAVSLLTPPPSEEIVKEFEEVKDVI